MLVTYYKAPEPLTKEDLLSQLQGNLSLLHRHLIYVERDQEGNKVMHAFLESKSKFRILAKKRSILDLHELDSKDTISYANYQPVRSLRFFAARVTKDYITNYDNFHQGKFLPIEKDSMETRSKKGSDAAYQKSISLKQTDTDLIERRKKRQVIEKPLKKTEEGKNRIF